MGYTNKYSGVQSIKSVVTSSMAALRTISNISRTLNNATNLLKNLSLNCNGTFHVIKPVITQRICIALVHTTQKRYDLMEFFEDKKNWMLEKIRVGRSWKIEELRIKSNEDLHKLWYVLLKERNMLLTMEAAFLDEYKYFPNPERIDKVEQSMENLEEVVRERNKAYHLLETGHTGERPARIVNTQLGLKTVYKLHQHIIPCGMNKRWQRRHKFSYGGFAVRKFLRLYYEKKMLKDEKKMFGQKRYVEKLFRRFPHMSIEAVKAAYPDVDVEKIRQSDKARGHYVPQ